MAYLQQGLVADVTSDLQTFGNGDDEHNEYDDEHQNDDDPLSVADVCKHTHTSSRHAAPPCVTSHSFKHRYINRKDTICIRKSISDDSLGCLIKDSYDKQYREGHVLSCASFYNMNQACSVTHRRRLLTNLKRNKQPTVTILYSYTFCLHQCINKITNYQHTTSELVFIYAAASFGLHTCT